MASAMPKPEIEQMAAERQRLVPVDGGRARGSLFDQRIGDDMSGCEGDAVEGALRLSAWQWFARQLVASTPSSLGSLIFMVSTSR